MAIVFDTFSFSGIRASLKEFYRRGGSRSVTCDEVLTLTPCGPGGRVGHVETQTVKLALRYTWWSPCGDRKGTKWD